MLTKGGAAQRVCPTRASMLFQAGSAVEKKVVQPGMALLPL
jgi:hypothetical protein